MVTQQMTVKSKEIEGYDGTEQEDSKLRSPEMDVVESYGKLI